MVRPLFPLALVLATLLSGCAFVDITKDDCGPSQTTSADGPPWMNMFTPAEGIAYQIFVSAEAACHKEHITYTATASIEADRGDCPREQKVVVKERPGAGAADFTLLESSVSAGLRLYERSADFGLAQFGRTERFTIYLDVIIPGPRECGERVRAASLTASYRLPEE